MEGTQYPSATIWDSSHCPTSHFYVSKQFHLLWVIDGECDLSIDGIRYQLTSKSGCMIGPNQFYSIRLSTSVSRVYEISFTPQGTLSTLLEDIYVRPYIENHYPPYMYDSNQKQDRTALQAAEKAVNRLLSNDDFSLFDSLLHLTVIWRHRIQRMNEPMYRSSSLNRVTNLLHSIHSEKLSRLTLTQLADHNKLSKSECCRLFTRYLGTSPSQYIQSVRMHNAANTLLTTQLSIAETAQLYEYSSVSHFVQSFKAHHSITPLAYRKKHQTKRAE